MRDVPAFLSQQKAQTPPDLSAEWEKLEELYNRKLWHQLTLQLTTFVNSPHFAQGDGLLKLYENFLVDFEHRINPLSLVEIILIIIKQIKVPAEAISFLEKTKEKVKGNEEAVILCMTAMGTIYLSQNNLTEVKTVVEQAGAMVDNIDGVTTVHGRFYDLSSNYHRITGSHADFYREALRFLGCMEIQNIPVEEQRERAFNLGLAALLGDGVYNFGELLAHPVLDSLRNTDKQWLVDLLYAFNAGNLAAIEKLRPKWQAQPDLAANELSLQQKVRLLCLMEMTFTRPANDRQLTFQEIAAEAKLPLEEVELLVMKALSLGLVKGHIDQVDSRVHMTWVQPRVLDLAQIRKMKDRLDMWCGDVNSMEMMVEVKATDLLT
ncbi:PREDICTED: 26S proteasome non-ATPase regulatory subunit 13-like [Branchiostoma belcheri]|uniref:26S proteasome non-ATPase regulatory subunit 13 n=1 Tax=Branchiostoma belcheri TaxID=7741 RepID=A0A6P4ZVE1_BRABE|nr:PREDICTED: 26S proteasome non-ATPase regulatory subunit 13-like [Branchiostoma belcheri]